MQYEYRKLSKEKSEKLNAMEVTGMYGDKVSFDDGEECLTTPDEKIVFTQISFSHESDLPDWYFLDYNGWYYTIYMFLRSARLERCGEPIAIEKLVKEKHKKRRKLASDYFIEYEIEAIGTGLKGENASTECKPVESEIMEALKEVIPVWAEYATGLKFPRDRYFTTIRYKDELLLQKHCLSEKDRFAWRQIDDEMKEELYQYYSKNIDRYWIWKSSVSWDYGVYSVDSGFFMGVCNYDNFLDEVNNNCNGDAIVFVKGEEGFDKGEIAWYHNGSGKLCVNIKSKKLMEYQFTIEAAVKYLLGKGKNDVRVMKSTEVDNTKNEYYADKLKEDAQKYEKRKRMYKRIDTILKILLFPITIVFYIVGLLYLFWLGRVIGKMG